MSKSSRRQPSRPFQGSTVDRELLAAVKAHGFGCTALMPNPPSTPVGWTYTVGLTVRRLPELVIGDIPAQKAVPYLGFAAMSMMAERPLSEKDEIHMFDGTVWTARGQLARATHYGVPSALQLYGDKHSVRAIRLMPPWEMAWVPGTIWPGYQCECGCEPNGDPLAAIGHQVGSRFMSR